MNTHLLEGPPALLRICARHSSRQFVSHSWSDPGEPKFKSLQTWKEPFIENEVDPVLWLDKAVRVAVGRLRWRPCDAYVPLTCRVVRRVASV